MIWKILQSSVNEVTIILKVISGMLELEVEGLGGAGFYQSAYLEKGGGGG